MTVVSGWRQVPQVLATAGRLIVRHWPMLLALACLGNALRGAALWAAVVVSDWNSFAGQLFLVFTPLGYLLPIIAMLHLMRRSLPALSRLADEPGPVATTEGRERRLVDVAVSFLVPFMAVYVSYGLLEEDRQRFINEAVFDEFNQFELGAENVYDFGGRVGIYSFQVLVLIVAVAWVVRWALGRFERRTSFLALAFVGALVEVYYTSQVARNWTGAKNLTQDWFEERVAVATVQDRYEQAVTALGPLANPVDAVTGWLFGLVGSLDAVVVVPLAWLTVAAVVLGHKLSPPTPPDPERSRWRRVPPRVRRMGTSLFADVVERWSAFWGGLRLLATTGLVPMLVFGLCFLVALQVPWLVSHVVRLVVGPVRTDTFLAFAPWEGALGLSLSMVVVAPLLAAAVEWLVAVRLTESSPDGASRTPEDRSSAGPS
jgi:hypothetical protein